MRQQGSKDRGHSIYFCNWSGNHTDIYNLFSLPSITCTPFFQPATKLIKIRYPVEWPKPTFLRDWNEIQRKLDFYICLRYGIVKIINFSNGYSGVRVSLGSMPIFLSLYCVQQPSFFIRISCPDYIVTTFFFSSPGSMGSSKVIWLFQHPSNFINPLDIKPPN